MAHVIACHVTESAKGKGPTGGRNRRVEHSNSARSRYVSVPNDREENGIALSEQRFARVQANAPPAPPAARSTFAAVPRFHRARVAHSAVGACVVRLGPTRAP